MLRPLDAIYLALVLAASPWLLWRRWRRGRWPAAIGDRFRGAVPPRPAGPGPVVWLHGVSVGEVNLLPCLIDRFRQIRPDIQCVVSTSTPTGFELAQRLFGADRVFYCPFDFSWSVRRALTSLRPDLLVLGELELWPQLLSAAQNLRIPVTVVNGRLSLRSHRGYRRIRRIASAMLRRIDWLGVQDATYAERFLDLGADPTTVDVTGSLKFDGVRVDRDNPQTQRLGRLAGAATGEAIWLAGSTQADDEAVVLEAYRRLAPRYPRLRLMIAPRHQERFEEAAAGVRQAGFSLTRRSAWEDDAGRDGWPAGDVLLVDSIGELRAWWGLATIAFVGGSMGRRGGQNMIEPAAYGAAVCFGPNTRNFREITDMLLREDAARVVRDAAELANFVESCLRDARQATQMGRRARALVLRNQGAADRTVRALLRLLDSHPSQRAA